MELKTCVDYRNERSHNGYRLDELKSGLQKYIRRCETYKAVWCAIELDMFAMVSGGERVRTNLIHRLMIIFLEDVGVEGLQYWPTMDEYINELFRLRKLENRAAQRVEEMNIIVKIVTLMCKCNHSRQCSHYGRVFGGLIHNPEEILDCEKFYDPESARLENMYKSIVKTDDMQEIIKNIHTCLNTKSDLVAYWSLLLKNLHPTLDKPVNKIKATESLLINIIGNYVTREYSDLALKWFKELKNLKEKFLPWMSIILIYFNDIQSKKPKFTPYMSFTRADEYISMKFVTMDKYVLDIHTNRGRRRGPKDKYDFVLTGAVVQNESHLTNKLYHEIYKMTGLLSSERYLPLNYIVDSKTKESDVFSFVMRAQLTTSQAKPDTYFAINKLTDERVFVKGPYITEDLDYISMIERLKHHIGLTSVKVDVLQLIPDLLVSPLGTRTRISPDIRYDFLMFEDLTRGKKLTGKTVKSKVWPETEVVDWDKITGCSYIELTDDWLEHGLFRYLAGIPDPARRNFINVDGVVYAVDTEGYDRYKVGFNPTMKRMIDEFKSENKKLIDQWYKDVKYIAEFKWFKMRLDYYPKGLENPHYT